MADEEYRLPTIIVPYTGPCSVGVCHDVFVYLRPETNGVEVESTIMRTIRGTPKYSEHVSLAYLANIPGDFINSRKIVEKHYRLQLRFAVEGKSAFTGEMKRRFSAYFKTGFEQAEILGAFEAMKRLNMSYDELFQIYVPYEDMTRICGQTIKRYRGMFIVNYDLPALLHKNTNSTDIAVMIFRTDFQYTTIHEMIDSMGAALINAGTLHSGKPMSRVFHYSKGPFDQIRDAIGYLYTSEARHISFKRIAFAYFLIDKGISMHRILGVIRNPLCRFRTDSGTVEAEIFEYTSDSSFEEAHQKFLSIERQYLLV